MVLDSEKYPAVGKGKFQQHLPGKLQSVDYGKDEFYSFSLKS